MERPRNVGIKAIEIYVPNQCVDQAELEAFDGVSQGKYTIGLGQSRMSFCDDREDIYSLALTTVSSLLRKYNIDPATIGRLEVGTETILDKSKSVKSVLMQLFQDANTDIEGADTTNACYGGTNALFNAVNWVESSAWAGRDAIVVAGDIALYDKGAARPTGGAGCVAMLVGANAPIVLEPGLRASYVRHAYDFYKPDFSVEYPHVDGPLSLRCYTEALDACYRAYLAREKRLLPSSSGRPGENGHTEEPQHRPGSSLSVERFDYMCFHAPTCQTVAKAYGRLWYNDYLSHPGHDRFASVSAERLAIDYDASLVDKALEKEFMALSRKDFAQRVQGSTLVPAECGNMYSASLYAGLCGLLSLVDSERLQGKRIGMFSYGSGLVSSMFSLKVVGGTDAIRSQLDILKRLDQRITMPPSAYDEICALRERAHQKKAYQPRGSTDRLTRGTYYLVDVDQRFRRTYAVKH